MQNKKKTLRHRLRAVPLVSLLLLSGALPAAEPDLSGWQLYLDNDLFSGAGSDRDYTGGLALSLDGARTARWWFSLDRALAALDAVSGMARRRGDRPRRWRHSLEAGLLLFTPSDIRRSDPIPDDHPYASLLFLTSARQTVSADGRHVDHSTLTVGLLGTPLGEALQDAIHDALGGTRPAGWRHQISAGGEPTVRYAVGRQTLLRARRAGGRGYDLVWGSKAGLGYATDVTGLLRFRWGRIVTPWWAFAPHQADYISLGISEPGGLARAAAERFLWGGFSLRLRAYNAILQGQFRHSDVTFPSDRLNHLIAEAWLGATLKTARGWAISFVLRGRTPEIRAGRQSGPLWGSLVLSHTLR